MDSSLLLGGWRLSVGTRRLGDYHQGQLCQVKDIRREGCINMVMRSRGCVTALDAVIIYKISLLVHSLAVLSHLNGVF